MKSILKTTLILLFLVFISTQNAVSQEQTDDEAALKATVEAFLLALGTNDTLALPTFFLPNANIGSIRVKDGKTSIYTNSVEQWLADRAQKENNQFEEPVQEYSIEITQGRLAFVRANTTLLYNGEPSHYAHDFFVLMKDEGKWKFLSGSYTNLPLEKE